MQQPPDPEASRAVLIGTAGYANLPELTAVTRNLAAMHTMLCDADLWGPADASCRIIKDPEQPADVVDGVSEAAREAKDTLVVYYAGHGLLDADNIDLHLALRHSREFRGYTALSYHYIRQAVMRSPARRRIVILDCCYSGRAAHPLMGANGDDLAQHAVVEGTYVLTSSSRDSVSLSPAGEVHGVHRRVALDRARRYPRRAGPDRPRNPVHAPRPPAACPQPSPSAAELPCGAPGTPTSHPTISICTCTCTCRSCSTNSARSTRPRRFSGRCT
ncbi:caspase family protein [Embleya sp. NPDC020630]|uniref:caspase, EACC1-associated type n=1 Tax=Embleya sp. NPDC020630 TaxID=3363979 RepID=UPI003795C67B